MMTEPRALTIMDCDPGTDDAVALYCLSKLNQFPQVVIGTFGNAPCATTVANAALWARYLGETPHLVQGAASPLQGGQVSCGDFHGADALAGLSADLRSRYGALQVEDTLEDLLPYLRTYNRITYLATGPLTSLAWLLSADPTLAKRLEHVYIMGGGLKVFNYAHETEYNFVADPQAVQQVLAAGLHPVLFPLDLTCTCALVTAPQLETLKQLGSPHELVQLLATNLHSNGQGAAVLHDVCPALYGCNPADFTTREVQLCADQWAHLTEVTTGGYPVTLATHCPPTLIFEMLRSTL